MSEIQDGQELFFGLVSPVGTDDKQVITALNTALDSVKYAHQVIQLSDFLKKIDGLTN